MATFGSFVSGQVLTAAELNAAGTWASYTPTWTQSATITKTTNFARYMEFNKLVIGAVKMTASSAGTANNKILVGLPVSASANNFIVGSAIYTDASTSSKFIHPICAFYESSTTIAFYPVGTSGTNFFSSFNPTVDTVRMGQNFTDLNTSSSITGITVASGDVIYVQFCYEAA